MTTTEIRQALPTGTWHLDPVHSSIGFEVAYMGGAFRGQFREVDATLHDARLTGSAKVASVDVKDENLAAHLQSPEFFDVERAACASDRRVTYAVLTDAGLAKLREAADSHVAAVQALFDERYSEDELGQLGRLLARLPGAEGTAAESCSP